MSFKNFREHFYRTKLTPKRTPAEGPVYLLSTSLNKTYFWDLVNVVMIGLDVKAETLSSRGKLAQKSIWCTKYAILEWTHEYLTS